MKLFTLGFVLIAGLFSSFAVASYPADCQMRVLKIATDAYEDHWGEFSKLYSIKNIQMAFDQKLQEDIVTLEGSQITWSHPVQPACTLRVYVKNLPANGPGCPEYQLDRLVNSCP